MYERCEGSLGLKVLDGVSVQSVLQSREAALRGNTTWVISCYFLKGRKFTRWLPFWQHLLKASAGPSRKGTGRRLRTTRPLLNNLSSAHLFVSRRLSASLGWSFLIQTFSRDKDREKKGGEKKGKLASDKLFVWFRQETKASIIFVSRLSKLSLAAVDVCC